MCICVYHLKFVDGLPIKVIHLCLAFGSHTGIYRAKTMDQNNTKCPQLWARYQDCLLWVERTCVIVLVELTLPFIPVIVAITIICVCITSEKLILVTKGRQYK